MSDFFDSFNAALPELETSFGEPFYHGTALCSAISIDALEVSTRVMAGGQFFDATVVILVRADEFARAGLAEGNKITARNQSLRIIATMTEGDGSITLTCGPTGVKNTLQR